MCSSDLSDVRVKLAELHALEASLSRFVVSCNAACVGGAAVDCTILEDLSHPHVGVASASSCCAPAKVASS